MTSACEEPCLTDSRCRACSGGGRGSSGAEDRVGQVGGSFRHEIMLSPTGREGREPKRARTVKPPRPSFCVSLATALPGLAESELISCFLKHYTPLCAVANEASIRDGLMYAISNLQTRDSLEDLLLEEDQRGQALQCSLFSAMAIGGLMSGYPLASVSRHMDVARICRRGFWNLRDKTALSALILYAMAHSFAAGATGAGGSRTGPRKEYHEAMQQAKAVYNDLCEKDPLVSCFIAYRSFVDGVDQLTLTMVKSVNPLSAFGRVMDTSGMKIRTEGAKRVRDGISKGHQQGQLKATQCGKDKAAHPSLALVDAGLLLLCPTNSGGDGSSGYGHVHDYLVSELERLERVEAGALVLNGVATFLVVAKVRMFRMDGLLQLADGISSRLHQFPGLARHDKGLLAFLPLAVFRLLNERERYDSLREVTRSGSIASESIPTFDEYLRGIPLCRIPIVDHTCGLILTLDSLADLDTNSSSILAGIEADLLATSPTAPFSQDTVAASPITHFQQQPEARAVTSPTPPLLEDHAAAFCSPTVRVQETPGVPDYSFLAGRGESLSPLSLPPMPQHVSNPPTIPFQQSEASSPGNSFRDNYVAPSHPAFFRRDRV